MAYDAKRRRVVMFGGEHASGITGETWEWDGVRWTKRTPVATPTASRPTRQSGSEIRILRSSMKQNQLRPADSVRRSSWRVSSSTRASTARKVLRISGSFVVAGQGRFAATAVGDQAYAARLAREAKEFTSVHSELRAGTDTILAVGVWVMVPATVLLIISQLRSAPSVSDALRSSVAGIGAIVPEGLVLLTSLAFAVGATTFRRRDIA